MSKSHAAGWASDAPTPAQLKELFDQISNGRVTKGRMQTFLRGNDGETGMYPWPTPDQMRSKLAEWNERFKLGLPLGDLGEPPEFPVNPNEVAVIAASTGDPEKDFRNVVTVLEGDDSIPFYKSFLSKKKDLPRMECLCEEQGAQYQVIDLADNQDISTKQLQQEVRPYNLPTTGLLWFWPLVGALSPDAIKQFRERTGIWATDIAGYRLRGRFPPKVPFFCWRPDDRDFKLEVRDSDLAGPVISVPLCRE